MYFCHSTEIWRDYPELVPGVLLVEGITREAAIGEQVAKFEAIAHSRLATISEGELPEIRAWRRAFSKMGLKPTQYRCASESLLRRFRKEGSLPRIHPLIDLCNAISLAFAIPIAAFDVSKISDYIEVQYAMGSEVYLAFSGEVEHPHPGEVIFADGSGRAHARRWTNRQSGYSAVADDTVAVLIVAEAMHDSAQADVQKLIAAIAEELELAWSTAARTGILTEGAPRFEF
jgi:DNA/RNA-binding domain of Phe-tRNA-synthetase-like protein